MKKCTRDIRIGDIIRYQDTRFVGMVLSWSNDEHSKAKILVMDAPRILHANGTVRGQIKEWSIAGEASWTILARAGNE